MVLVLILLLLLSPNILTLRPSVKVAYNPRAFSLFKDAAIQKLPVNPTEIRIARFSKSIIIAKILAQNIVMQVAPIRSSDVSIEAIENTTNFIIEGSGSISGGTMDVSMIMLLNSYSCKGTIESAKFTFTSELAFTVSKDKLEVVVKGVNTAIFKDSVKLSVTGEINERVLDVLTCYLKHVFGEIVQAPLTEKFSEIIKQHAELVISWIPFDVPIADDFFAKFPYTGLPYTNLTHFIVPFNGFIHYKDKPDNTLYMPPDLPDYYQGCSSHAQVFIGDYMLYSAFDSLKEEGLLNFNLSDNSPCGINMTCSLDALTYMEVANYATIEVNGTCRANEYYVQHNKCQFVSSTDFSISLYTHLEPHVKDLALQFLVMRVKGKPLEIFYGPLSKHTLQRTLDIGAIDLVNSLQKLIDGKGIPLPVPNIFSLENIFLGSTEHYHIICADLFTS
eukprot:TRINITY_DN138054_c0_g1_i1.p1 TRINITY_DN138054_c0_g1~~TRINITY_DN138054_c0_g1_i1.p1  ORF type:complete len:472 (+),score=15.29 TRINITY_DN138054_c0_g1_i1:76-1416(+)